ncbi:MAG: type II toxin-antitoxin system Phd/YefM family antitoxin [Spirochaetales bacterium]|nr:type II toxin-antitoxin system Phd/YefM family antitoxin [Spirochaetales bacterium]
MKTISISQFKTHLSAEIKGVAEHGELVVLDHSRPVVRILPYRDREEPVAYRQATVAWEAGELPPLVEAGSTHAALMEDRGRR